jgi:hypothetical protein
MLNGPSNDPLQLMLPLASMMDLLSSLAATTAVPLLTVAQFFPLLKNQHYLQRERERCGE